jgi:alpha-ketoglutarate-dependent sulfate ester dioxygenase
MSGGLHVVQLGENIGARIEGVHLGAVDAETAAAINKALVTHKVIFFRGQNHLDDDSHYEFAESLGVPTTPHPTLKFEGSKVMRLESINGGGANQWHTDVTFVDRPPKASILRAVELPPYGGTTTWASTVAAYQQLPQPLKDLAENLWAVHNNAFDYAQIDPAKLAAVEADPDAIRKYASQFHSTHYETQHPVVRVHPPSRSSDSTAPSSRRCIGSSKIGSHGWRTQFDGTGNSATSQCGTIARPSTTRCPITAIRAAPCAASRWPATSR